MPRTKSTAKVSNAKSQARFTPAQEELQRKRDDLMAKRAEAQRQQTLRDSLMRTRENRRQAEDQAREKVKADTFKAKFAESERARKRKGK